MNPNINEEMVEPTVVTNTIKTPHPVHVNTPLSRYFAMALFIALPFVGAYVGFQLAGERVVEVPVSVDVVNATAEETETSSNSATEESFNTYSFLEEYPDKVEVSIPQEFKDNYSITELSQYQSMNADGLYISQYLKKNGEIFRVSSNATSAESVFVPIVGADAASFVLNAVWPVYAKDKNHVYVHGEVILGADPKTFSPVCGYVPYTASHCAFSKDAAHVYWYTHSINGADPKTFRFLVGGKDYYSLAVDEKNVYWGPITPFVDSIYEPVITVSTLRDGSSLHFTNTEKISDAELSGMSDKSFTFGTGEYVDIFYFKDSSQWYGVYRKITNDPNDVKNLIEVSKVTKFGE